MKFRSLKTWPGELHTHRKHPPFKTGYTETMKLLDRELRMAGAVEPIVEVALHPQQFTREGFPYKEAQPEHPGVVVRFAKKVKGKDGTPQMVPLLFKCDQFTRYEANLRAIAIGMEDLRRVERYGVASEHGQQWLGFKALPAPGPEHEQVVTVEQAIRIIADESVEYQNDKGEVMRNPVIRQDAYRMAAKRLHPDGSEHDLERWEKLQAAKALVDRELGE
jgi:hypothetical protein